MENYLPGITVIVPTFKRIGDLNNCLAAIDRQALAPAEVLICYRPEDTETVAYLAQTDRPAAGARLILCEQPGQVYALTRAIDEAKTDYIAITDDDSIPREDWLERIVAHFEADPLVAGVGGRDQVFQNGKSLDGAEPLVGIVLWYGRTIGNHHIGVGPPRSVHTLKGANMSYRKSVLGDLRPDTRLRGKGAQVGNDMKLALSLAAQGHKLIYDPAVHVDHMEGARPVEEHRHQFNETSHKDAIFNRTLTLLEYLKTQRLGRIRQLAYLSYLTIRGTRLAPGILMLGVCLATRYPHTWKRFKATWAAMYEGVKAAR